MSGVKNLRAMFEQKQDSSPPDKGADRGRSPGDSSTTRSETPPRPLSKVRTNFIAVQEKDGRIGLRRDPSDDGSSRSLSRRRLSVNTEEGSVSALSERTNMAFAEPIPESPRAPETTMSSHGANGTNGGFSKQLGALTDHPSHNPDKHMDVETPTPKLLPADHTEKPPSKPLTVSTDKATKATTTKSAGAKSPTRQIPTRLQTNKTTTKAPAKSPALPKTPTNLPRATGTQAAKTAREPIKKSTDKTTATKPATTTTRTAAKASSSTATTKKATPAPVSISASNSTGFVKPKVKSPTRPVNLPSSLMAPTAASASHSRIARPTSRASVSTVATNTTTTSKTLRRQRSSINQPRPSLGPPPKKASQDHPVTKKEREVDESFLARMMRPTQSSSSKLNEKTPVTPPRKGAPKKDASSTKASTSTASGRKKIGQPAFATTGSPGQKKATSTEDVALAETAEDAIEVAADAGVEVPTEASPAKLDAEPAKELDIEPTVVEEPELEEAAAEETPADEAETNSKATDAATLADVVPQQEPTPAPVEGPESLANGDSAEHLPVVDDVSPADEEVIVEDERKIEEQIVPDTITPPRDLSTPEANAIVADDAAEVADVEDVGNVLESLKIADSPVKDDEAKEASIPATNGVVEGDKLETAGDATEGIVQEPAQKPVADIDTTPN